MFIIGNILSAIAGLLSTLISIYTFIIIASAVISWVNADPYNPIVKTLRQLTEPVYYRIRKALPFTMAGGFDFSPLILIFALQLIDGAIVQSIADLAYRM